MWINELLILVLIICIITDIRSRKIYNAVILPGLITAFVLHLLLEGWKAFGDSLLGFIAGLSILLIPYLLGGMGAGDVKLLGLIGALKGTVFVLVSSVYMGIFGAAAAIMVIILKKEVQQWVRFIVYYLYALRLGIHLPVAPGKPDFHGSYPYGIAIAGGTFVSLLIGGGGL